MSPAPSSPLHASAAPELASMASLSLTGTPDGRLLAHGTHQERFSLMLHERIVALERKVDEMEKAHAHAMDTIDDLTARTAGLECAAYDPDTNTFSDGSSLDWFVWEPVDTAHVLRAGACRPLPERYWAAPVTMVAVLDELDERVSFDTFVHAPVSRFGVQTRPIRIPRSDAPLTVRAFLAALHAFYDSPITEADLAGLDPQCDYVQDARAALREGKRVTWVDCIGNKKYGGNAWKTGRRDPFLCCGLVRYEGVKLQTTRNGRMSHHLCLGS